MHRCSSGRRLELSPRDIALFALLNRYRYLRSTYLHAFAGGASETRFKERLGDLFHKGYLDRPAQQWEFANSRYRPAVYEIGKRGRVIAREHGKPEDVRTYLSPLAHRQFAHSVLICESLASIELASLASDRVRLVSWSEILDRAPKTAQCRRMPFRLGDAAGSVQPDALFGLEYRANGNKTYRFFALEVDRGTMPVTRSDSGQSSYVAKLQAYERVMAQKIFRSQLGIPNLLVLTLTSSETRLRAIMSAARLTPENTKAFLFKVLCDLTRPAPELLLHPWQRAGAEPLQIDRA